MSRVLTISSQVVHGPVGNTAATPALQSYGHEVMQVPTILLSHHPGHGEPVVHRTPATVLGDLLQSVERAGGFAQLDGVLTGYFANAEQVQAVAETVSRLRELNRDLTVLVDPVIGDHGKLYVAEEIALAIKRLLLPLADIATPNAFELSWLTGLEVTDRASAERIASGLGLMEVIVTSVPDSDHLGTLLQCKPMCSYRRAQKLAKVPNGTGDFFAGHYLGARLTQDATRAFEQSFEALQTAIARSPADVLVTAV